MKTSDLFRRAKQLADLEGSDFITWNEAINNINESYIELYEKLINMGDNSFVESFYTVPGETELPKDFWQLKGVYLWNNGNLKTINRRSDNASIHFTSYELKNGKLCVFGNPSDVFVEYYKRPETLLMPPSDREVDLSSLPEGAEVLACHAHTFVYKTQDAETNDIICVYDMDGIKNADDIFEEYGPKIWINKDFVFTVLNDDLIVYDLATGETFTYTASIPLINESGDLLVINDDHICNLIFNGDAYAIRQIKEFTPVSGAEYYVCNDTLDDFYCIVDGSIYHNDTDTTQNAVNIIYADNKCYYLAKNKAGYLDEVENTLIRTGIGFPIGFISINQNTGYGYCVKKFNKYFVCAYCEDTELIFPNSFYFQMLSYLLAIAFRCKQNADITLLSNQLAMISQTFEDTLGSDAYQFPRMGNIYN